MDALESLTASIGEEEASILWPHLTVERFRPGTPMFREGVPSSYLYFLVSGTLNAKLATSDGDIGLGVVQPGQWLGEIGFVDRGAATATLVAGEPCLTLRMGHDELLELQRDHPRAAAVLMRTVTRQLADRLKKSTAGIVEQVAEGNYRLRKPAENRTWLQETLGWLLGTGGRA